MAEPRELGPVLGFMHALWSVDHALRTASKRMGRKLGVTGPQRLVIRLVGRFPACTAGELATLLSVDPSTLTGVLARLERRRLIERRADEHDRRRARFTLTADGRTLDRERSGTVEAAVRRALGRLGDGDIRVTRAVLEALASELTVGGP